MATKKPTRKTSKPVARKRAPRKKTVPAAPAAVVAAAAAPPDTRGAVSKPSYGIRLGTSVSSGTHWGVLEPRRGARTLRRYSEENVWVRIAINRRKREISRAKWSIHRVDDPEAPPDPILVRKATELFRFVNPKRESLRSLLDMLVEDLLVFDAGCFEKEKTIGGDIVALWAVDGSTIAPDPEWDGSKPDAPRYFQYLNGKQVAQLRNDQLVYMMANPRTNSTVGFAPLEVLFDTVEAELYGEDFEYRMLRNTAPAGVLDLGAGLSPEQVEAFREQWNSEIAGSYDVAITGGGDPGAGVGVRYTPFQRSAKDEQRREYMKWLATKVAGAFEMDLLAFNLSESVHRSVGNNMQAKTDDGLVGLATLIEEFLTRELLWELDPLHRHGFQFENLTVRDAMSEVKIDQIRMTIGTTTPNELRARDGYDPFPGSELSPGKPDPDHWANLPYPFNDNTAAPPAEDPLGEDDPPEPDDPNAGEDAPKDDGDEAEEEAKRDAPFVRSAASPNAEAEAALRSKLTAITDESRRRLERVWDDRKHRLTEVVRERLKAKAWNAHDFNGPLDGLGDDLTDDLPYREAVRAGRSAVPWDPTTDVDDVVTIWTSHTKTYADAVAPRIAGEIADWLHEEAPDESAADVETLLAAFDAKLEALRSSITRYADPPWGAGNNAYGDELAGQSILMVWVLDDAADHCDDCPELASGGPYEHLPTWPGMGDTQCLDKCKCYVEADPASWAASLQEAA